MIEFLNPRTLRKQTAVITVRMPAEMADKLRAFAHEHDVSLNTVCVTALDGLLKAHEAEVQLTRETMRIAGRAS